MRVRAGALAVVALATSLVAGAVERTPEEVRLEPPENVQWGLRNVGAGMTAVLGLWNYWYADIATMVDTVPADAQLEIFYVRANFQKQFTRATSPVRITMPSRIRTTHRDAVILRASSQGYKIVEQTYGVHELPEKILITLQPLPNSLTFVGYTDLAGRGTLTLRTTKEPQFRVMRSRDAPGFTLALAETANSVGEAPALAGGNLKNLEIAQVGEDLLVKVETREDGLEVRSKQNFDAIRQEHVFALDLVEKGARSPSNDEVRRQLEAIPLPGDGACRDRFEQTLRDGLDPEAIARAMRPSGGVGDLYRREAMLRVGRTHQGSVQLVSGETLRTGDPLELELALRSAGNVRGYFAFLAAYARTEPDPGVALRSLLAPDSEPAKFEQLHQKAEAVRASCPH